MKCQFCDEMSVHSNLCKDHFISYFEEKVIDTINKFGLILKSDKVAVACSGGKDSTSLLYILHKNGFNVEALAIDEGIAGYRDQTIEDLKKICDELGIKLNVHSYQENYSTTLDNFLSKHPGTKACSVCGVWRRNLLNRYAAGYDKIATGHNLDDEAQSVMMNLLLSNIKVLARLGPKTGIVDNEKFIPRVKPLYFCTEKETAVYSMLKGFDIQYSECPNAVDSFRASVRDQVNEMESMHPGTKKNIIEWFLEVKPALMKKYVGEIKLCSCGQPSENDLCKSCSLRIIVKV